MAKTLTERLEILKNTMDQQAPPLARFDALESKVDAFERKFLQFRDEVKEEFSATRRETRVLHEDVVERIKRLGEGRPKPRKAGN